MLSQRLCDAAGGYDKCGERLIRYFEASGLCILIIFFFCRAQSCIGYVELTFLPFFYKPNFSGQDGAFSGISFVLVTEVHQLAAQSLAAFLQKASECCGE